MPHRLNLNGANRHNAMPQSNKSSGQNVARSFFNKVLLSDCSLTLKLPVNLNKLCQQGIVSWRNIMEYCVSLLWICLVISVKYFKCASLFLGEREGKSGGRERKWLISARSIWNSFLFLAIVRDSQKISCNSLEFHPIPDDPWRFSLDASFRSGAIPQSKVLNATTFVNADTTNLSSVLRAFGRTKQSKWTRVKEREKGGTERRV